jgi:glycosyltransferase involved in cell wall biosynthesis
MQTIIVHHRSKHHAQNSGYGRLIDYLEAKTIPAGTTYLPYKIAKYISKNTNQNAGIYDVKSVYKDWQLFQQLVFSKNEPRTIHYLNAERDIRYCTQLTARFSKTSVCASFHKPPEVLLKTIHDTQYLKKINGAIAVGSNQVDFLKNWLNLEQVKFIPHGVDTTFFQPDSSKREEHTLLFVGQHLRDFEALNYAVPRLKEKIPSLKINAVLRNDYSKKINADSAVTVFSGLDDESLKKIYQQATLLFLPLQNVTACNSILEAMACGLPIVSTAVEGNASYVKNNSGILVPQNDYNALIDTTLSLLENQDALVKMSAAARITALDFEWKKVSKQVCAFYHEISIA